MIKIYDCSNSNERPEHRGGGGPVKNDVMRYLDENAYRYNCVFTDNPEQADVIITNDVFPEPILKLNKPMVKRMCAPFWHGSYFYRNIPLNHAATQADKVVFITEYSRQSYYRMCEGTTKSDSVVLHWVDPKTFYPNRTKDDEQVTFVASATDWNRAEKRYQDVVRFAELSRAKVLLIGTAPNHKTPDNIIKFGYISDPTHMAEIFNMADAFLNLSYRDAATKTVCQAISCGLPVLYASSGGVPEMVGECGLGIYESEGWNLTKTIPHFTDRELILGFLDFMAQYNILSKRLEDFDPQTYFKRMLDGYFDAVFDVVLNKEMA